MKAGRGEAVIIANPAAGRVNASRIGKARSVLVSAGFSPRFLLTKKRGDAEAYARAASAERPALMLAAGGDGTINEVMNGMTGSEVPLGILPLGTANVLAKEIGVPSSVGGALAKAINGRPRSVSLGEISSGGSKKLFCLMAGAGFDAETVYRMEQKSSGIGGKAAYVLAGLGLLIGMKDRKLILSIDGAEHECWHAIVSNGRKYAGDHTIAPDADICSPGFVITLIKDPGRVKIASFAAAVLLGMHGRLGFVETARGSEVRIEGSTKVQVDGDHFGDAPVSIRAIPDAIRLVF